MTDERSGPFFPGLYIAGDKAGQKPQTVPDVSLPGQVASFSGRYPFLSCHSSQHPLHSDPHSTRLLTCFRPFTPKISSTPGVLDSRLMYVSSSFVKGKLDRKLQGVNNHGLNVRKNFDAFADAPLSSNDGMYQPFLTAASVGAEYDLSKIREVSGNFNLPVPGLNELFDFDGRFMVKGMTHLSLSLVSFVSFSRRRKRYSEQCDGVPADTRRSERTCSVHFQVPQFHGGSSYALRPCCSERQFVCTWKRQDYGETHAKQIKSDYDWLDFEIRDNICNK